jgi:hypothetical protein
MDNIVDLGVDHPVMGAVGGCVVTGGARAGGGGGGILEMP